MVHHLKNEINPLFADKAAIILESARYPREITVNICIFIKHIFNIELI